MTPEQQIEIIKCTKSPTYFIHNYVFIYDSVERDWIKFALWPAQRKAINLVHKEQLVVILKSRQIGLTWCLLGYALWSMLFNPVAEILLFSRRDDEAVNLLDNRLKGMYNRLPDWMKTTRVLQSNTHAFGLSNGSNARAFPTTGGDSYTATFVLVDEADLVENFNQLMRAVKPTIDNGGKLACLSRADKDTPQSEFKRIYKAAIKGQTKWKSIFLPWNVHPNRTQEWYEEQKSDILHRTTALDDLYEQYPNTPEEALLPKTLDKRIPGKFLLAQYKELPLHSLSTDIFNIFIPPSKEREYRIGADPAEGNPNSDASVAIVVDKNTGEQVAYIEGKYEPALFSYYVRELSIMYNNAPILYERNNHGHACILWHQVMHEDEIRLLEGFDEKPGWNSNRLGKSKMYTDLVDFLRTKNCLIHSEQTFNELSFIEGATLLAPEGEHDDHAMAFGLAQEARLLELSGFELAIGKGNDMYGAKHR